MENKYSENEIKVEGKADKWFENFWYYHKWKVFVALFSAFVLAVCVYSCVSKPKTDITVLYAGPFNSSESVPAINAGLTSSAPTSIIRNGISVNILTVYSEKQWTELATREVNEYIAEQEREYSEQEKNTLIRERIDAYKSITAENTKAFGEHLGIGRYAICFVDPSVYENYKDMKIFASISDIFEGSTPNTVYDECAIKLSETQLYKNDPNGVGKLPKDTLLCLRVEPVLTGCGGGGRSEYKNAIQVFKIFAQ